MGVKIERVKKIFHRVVRIITFRIGIYGQIGHRNKFLRNVTIDEKSKIGNYNYFGRNVSITNSEIGNYCSVAPNVIIGPGEHPLDLISTRTIVMEEAGYNVNLTRDPVKIGNDVWIGTNVVVLRGVEIGNGAVIAAGAIVNRDVPAYSIVGGIPAKLIRFRFENQIRDMINKSAWFEQTELRVAATLVKRLQELKDT